MTKIPFSIRAKPLDNGDIRYEAFVDMKWELYATVTKLALRHMKGDVDYLDVLMTALENEAMRHAATTT